MNIASLSIIRLNRRWFVDCNTTRHGPYTSAETATQVALGEARALQRKAHTVKVSVHDENGDISSVFFVGPELNASRE